MFRMLALWQKTSSRSSRQVQDFLSGWEAPAYWFQSESCSCRLLLPLKKVPRHRGGSLDNGGVEYTVG